jgi:PadR family transcriptional regulator PadR
MPGKFLGEFELYLMLAAAGLGGDNASGSAIRKEVEKRTGREVAIGAMYTTLSRLSDKGLVKSQLIVPSGESGGRAAKHYSLTETGKEATHHSAIALKHMMAGLDVVEGSLDIQ